MSRHTSDTCCAIVTRPIHPRHRYWPSANSTQWALHGRYPIIEAFLWEADDRHGVDAHRDGADADDDGADGAVDTGEGAASARVALGKQVAEAKKKEKRQEKKKEPTEKEKDDKKKEKEKKEKEKKGKEKEADKPKPVLGRNAANYHRDEAVPPDFYVSQADAKKCRKDSSDTRSHSRARTLRANLRDNQWYCSMDLGPSRLSADGCRERACLQGTCLDDTCLRTCLTRSLPFPQVLKDARSTFFDFACDCLCDEHEEQMCSLCRVPALVVATTKGATTMEKGETVYVKHHVSSRPTVLMCTTSE